MSKPRWLVFYRTCSDCNEEGFLLRSQEPTEEEMRDYEKQQGYCTRWRVVRLDVDGDFVDFKQHE